VKYHAFCIALAGFSLVGSECFAQLQPGTRIRYLTRVDTLVPFEGEYAGRIGDTILVARPNASLARVPVDSIVDFSFRVTVPRGGIGPALIGGAVGFEIGNRTVSFDGGGGLGGLIASVFKILLFTAGGAAIGVLLPTHEWRGIDPHLIQETGESQYATPRFARSNSLDERLAVET
jgi:hypothetical protein